MRRIEQFARFKRDRRRESKGQHRAGLNAFLTEALQHSVYDLPLSEQDRDHALVGDWSDHRECDLKPDLILIYRKIDDDVLCSWRASVSTANWGCEVMFRALSTSEPSRIDFERSFFGHSKSSINEFSNVAISSTLAVLVMEWGWNLCFLPPWSVYSPAGLNVNSKKTTSCGFFSSSLLRCCSMHQERRRERP